MCKLPVKDFAAESKNVGSSLKKYSYYSYYSNTSANRHIEASMGTLVPTRCETDITAVGTGIADRDNTVSDSKSPHHNTDSDYSAGDQSNTRADKFSMQSLTRKKSVARINNPVQTSCKRETVNSFGDYLGKDAACETPVFPTAQSKRSAKNPKNATFKNRQDPRVSHTKWKKFLSRPECNSR